MPVIKLTQNFVDHHLFCPAGKVHLEFRDNDRSQFFIEVRETSQGQGTYFQRFSPPISALIKIGKTTSMDLATAKDKAKKLRAEVALGKHPKADQKINNEIPTLSEYFDSHYKPYSEPRKRSFSYDETMFIKRIKPVFGKLRLDQIKRHKIQEFHTSLKNEGLAPATCDHHLKLIKYMLNLAVRWDLIDTNVASKIPMFNIDNRRETYLSESDVTRLVKVLQSDKNKIVATLILFLLASGCRFNEAATAKFSDFHLERKIWRVPAKSSKGLKTQSKPINDICYDIISNADKSSEFLFPNKSTGLPYTSIRASWTRIKRLANIDPATRLHDIRHSFSAMVLRSKGTLFELQTLLSHSDPSVTLRYAHLEMDQLRQVSNDASKIIQEAMNSE